MKNKLLIWAALLTLVSCTTQPTVINVEPSVQPVKPIEQSLKRKVAIARFSNETQYAKGMFFNKENDPMGKQAVDILSAKLSATNKFILLERQDVDKIMNEMELAGDGNYQKVGADFLIIGSITEFGRKNVGDVNAFSRSKTQTVEAGVNIRLVDVSTGQIIYSEEAQGQAQTTNTTVMGLGERTDYDATLSDKAISAAISKLVENIITNCMDRPWKSYFLTHDESGIIISGGASQGIRVDQIYEVIEKGRSVKNPQTGMMIELPGKPVGKIRIDFMGGETPISEFSIVSFIDGHVDPQRLDEYFIKESK